MLFISGVKVFISRRILCIHVIDTADEYRTLLRYRVMIVTLCCTCTSAALEGAEDCGVRIAPMENHKWLSRLIGINTSVCNNLATHFDNHCSCLLSGLSCWQSYGDGFYKLVTRY